MKKFVVKRGIPGAGRLSASDLKAVSQSSRRRSCPPHQQGQGDR